MPLTGNIDQAIFEVAATFKAYDAEKLALVRRNALFALQDIIFQSPVLTGFYRSAHDLTIGKPSSFLPRRTARERALLRDRRLIRRAGRGDTAAIRMLAQRNRSRTVGTRLTTAQARLNSLTLLGGATSVVIFIANNLPYAGRIEHGLSKQAPQGVYGVAAVRMQTKLAAEAARLTAQRVP